MTDKDTTMEERFDERFPQLSLTVSDNTGGYDATPYVKAFIASEKERSRREGEEGLQEAIKFLEIYVDDEECRFDHHGYCQTHFGGFEDDKRCRNQVVKDFISLHTPTQHSEEESNPLSTTEEERSV